MLSNEFLSHLQLLESEGRAIAPITPNVLALFEDDEQRVKNAMRELTKCQEGSREECELVSIVEHWNGDGSFVSLWAMVVLGNMHSQAAIPALLSVLDSEADYWREAAMEALERIAEQYPQEIITLVSEFIDDRFVHDPFDARLFAYSAIAVCAPNEDAERFLVYAFEREDTWKGSLMHDLAGFDDRRIRELFKRALAYAEHTHNADDAQEIKEAFCTFDGDQLNILAFDAKRRKEWGNWEERWKHQFSSLGKTEKEIEKRDELESQQFLERLNDPVREKHWKQETERHNAICDAYTVEPFDVDAYLEIRVRSSYEEAFDEALRLLGFDAQWTVEDVQREIDRAQMPSEVLERLIGDFEFPSTGAFKLFSERFMELWNNTPRTSFNGLKPSEMSSVEADEPLIQNKPGRNEPCPCGSGKKFKKCHGA